MTIGKLGVWTAMTSMTADECASFARRVENWGYSTLWVPEAVGRDPMVACSWLLANTTRLQLATGIASIYSRDALATINSQHALAEQSGGRFLLGLGVSHAPLIEGLRGQTYASPLAKMKGYLEGMQQALYMSPPPAEKPRTVLAALGPKMIELAASHADGIHSYNVTPEHTAEARKVLGPDKLLCPELMVVLETDPMKAREIARALIGPFYLTMPNYRNSFLRLGFTEDDLENNGSDKLIDAIVAWGDEAAIRDRIQQHWDAGADHVCIQSIPRSNIMKLSPEDETVFELLAPSRN